MKAEFVYKIGLLGLLLVAGTARSAQPPAATATPPKLEAPVIEKSVFTDTPGFGRDPFFPNSKRRQQVVVPKTFVTGEIPNTIVLKGMSGTTQNRLVVINNYTLAEGEETDIRAGGQIFRVRCVEIRERSVMISVNGMEPKELRMRTGL